MGALEVRPVVTSSTPSTYVGSVSAISGSTNAAVNEVASTSR